MSRDRRPSVRTIAFALGLLAVAGLWFTMLRPQSLGGGAGYVMVRGTSMLPTYVTGDLVVTHRATEYKKGDIVAYRVPEGDFGAGIVVIHRIIGGSAEAGFVIQGDNNPYRDDWFPKPTDIVGRAWVHVPHAGLVLGFLHAPVPLASLASAVAIVMVLFPEDEKKKRAQKVGTVTPVVPALSVAPMLPVLAVIACVVHQPRRMTIAPAVAVGAPLATVIELPATPELERAA